MGFDTPGLCSGGEMTVPTQVLESVERCLVLDSPYNHYYATLAQ